MPSAAPPRNLKKAPRRPNRKISGSAYAKAEQHIAAASEQRATNLNLSIDGLTRIPPLAGLAALRSLELAATYVSDFAPLASLTSLQSLSLILNRISDLAPLAGLIALQNLDLRGTPVSNLAPLAGLAGLQSLDLRLTKILELTPLAGLTSLQSLYLGITDVSNLAPLAGLTGLQSLDIGGTKVSDLAPVAGLTRLQSLDLSETEVSDLAPLASLITLQKLDLGRTQVLDLVPLAGLTDLQSLDLSETKVSDLAPLVGLTTLIDGAKKGGGLSCAGCTLTDKTLLAFSSLENPARTEKIINYLREQQGLPPYFGKYEDDKPPLPKDSPEAIEGVPSPFDFQVTAHGTIAVAGSDTNLPTFPFATSREDHARRLETCKVSAGDLIEALSAQRYHNVRQEYLSYLQRYQERLPQSAENGNMLLADGVARSLSKLFSAEAVILPDAFAAELHTLLEQHIATCAYYPEIGTFNRDVRDGKPSRPFPLMAVEALVQAVQVHTPSTFEPSVSRALSEVQISPPLPPAVPADLPPSSPQTILPPPIPGGETDPRKSQEFAKASTANRLWKVVKVTAVGSTATRGVIDASQALAPHVKEIIDWLSNVIASL